MAINTRDVHRHHDVHDVSSSEQFHIVSPTIFSGQRMSIRAVSRAAASSACLYVRIQSVFTVHEVAEVSTEVSSSTKQSKPVKTLNKTVSG